MIGGGLVGDGQVGGGQVGDGLVGGGPGARSCDGDDDDWCN